MNRNCLKKQKRNYFFHIYPELKRTKPSQTESLCLPVRPSSLNSNPLRASLCFKSSVTLPDPCLLGPCSSPELSARLRLTPGLLGYVVPSVVSSSSGGRSLDVAILSRSVVRKLTRDSTQLFHYVSLLNKTIDRGGGSTLICYCTTV